MAFTITKVLPDWSDVSRYHHSLLIKKLPVKKIIKSDARDGIRTQELLRDQALNLTPLTWLGYPRACIDYI